MGAPLENSNAVGNSGGKTLNDRKLAADVRRMTLKKILKLLEQPDNERSQYELDLYKAVLIKLAGTVLPRLNEVTGEDGGRIVFTVAREIAEKNDITTASSPEGDSTGQAPL